MPESVAITRIRIHAFQSFRKDELRTTPGDRRLATHRVRRCRRMQRVRDQLEAGKESSVVDGGRDLAHAAADGVDESLAGDHRAATKPRSRVRRPSARLSEKISPGTDDSPVKQLSGALDVGHARRAAGIFGRELGDELEPRPRGRSGGLRCGAAHAAEYEHCRTRGERANHASHETIGSPLCRFDRLSRRIRRTTTSRVDRVGYFRSPNRLASASSPNRCDESAT